MAFSPGDISLLFFTRQQKQGWMRTLTCWWLYPKIFRGASDRDRGVRTNWVGFPQSDWLIVWNMFYCFPYVRNNPSIWRTHLFQRGWKHQPDNVGFWMCFVHLCSYLLVIFLAWDALLDLTLWVTSISQRLTGSFASPHIPSGKTNRTIEYHIFFTWPFSICWSTKG